MTQQLMIPRASIQTLADGYARGGHDNSALTERGIRGIFYDGLENNFDDTWASRVGIYIPSDTLTEKHRWLGQTPGFREWFGGLHAKGILDNEIQITNKDYEVSLDVSLHDWRRDKTGHIVRRIGELGSRANNHWEEIAITNVIEGNPTCYDGTTLFSATHSSGSSGTQKNLLTATEVPALNVATATNPTREEAGDILAGLAAYFFTYLDDQGKKSNQGARNFLLMCKPSVLPAFRGAVRDLLYAQGGTGKTQNLGWNFEVVPEPLLTGAASVVYMFRTDAPSSRPVILQEEKAPEIKFLGEDSEYAVKNNAVLVSARMCRNVGPGEWRHAIKATMS